MAGAVGVHHLTGDDFPVLHIIELKLLRMTEVLENFPVFIGNRNSHDRFSFGFFKLLLKLPSGAVLPGTAHILAAAQAVVSARNLQGMAIHQGIGDLSPGCFVDPLHRRPGHSHLPSGLLLGKADLVHQPDHFKFIHTEDHRFPRLPSGRAEQKRLRIAADPAAFRGSWHCITPDIILSK